MALFDVKVQGVEMHDFLPIVVRSWDLGNTEKTPDGKRVKKTVGVRVQTHGDEDIDLLYHLTKRNSSFERLMMKYPDGKYRILVGKESMVSRLRKKAAKGKFTKYPTHFVWHGWALLTKNKDQIFFDNRWLQVGHMNKYNLDVEPRDVQAEVRRTNWDKVPGGGLPRPQAWDSQKEDRVSDMMKKRLHRVY